MSEQENNDSAGGPGSFCISKAALDALLNAKATAYEICAYLVLSRFTDATGRYSTASISAVNRYTGANKVKGGPVHRAIERLKTIHVKDTTLVSNGRSGKSHRMVEQTVDRGPILFDRDTWRAQTEEIMPDGPTERGKVLFVLPDFEEQIEDRIWFGGNLVTGVGGFNQPLKALKNAGDVAARLLLLLYMVHDMEIWGGVCPIGKESGPWKHYEPVADDVHLHGGARLIRAKDQGIVGPGGMFARAWPPPANQQWWKAHENAGNPCFEAIHALSSAGLIYEMVLVLNRAAIKSQFGSGSEYGDIAGDAEPLYELDCRSLHGYKPEGEEGIGGATANTAGALGFPVAVEGARLDGTYAAIVPHGYPAMIAGIYRLRFRVANPKNAGVKGAWARIYQNNREAFDLVQSIRVANRLPMLAPPPAASSKIAKPPGRRQPGKDQETKVAVDNLPF